MTGQDKQETSAVALAGSRTTFPRWGWWAEIFFVGVVVGLAGGPTSWHAYAAAAAAWAAVWIERS